MSYVVFIHKCAPNREPYSHVKRLGMLFQKLERETNAGVAQVLFDL